MARADQPRHAFGERQLVVGRIVETDAERAQLPRRQILRRQHGDQRGIDPSAQENPERHVGHHAPPHRGGQQRAQFLAPFVRRPALRRFGLVFPVTPHLEFARAQVIGQRMSARQLAGPLGHGQRRGHVTIGEIFPHSLGARSARHVRMFEKRRQLGGEHEQTPRRRMVIIKRLFAEPVAAAEKFPAPPVVDDERPHAVQAVDHFLAPLGIRLEQHLGVGVVRPEGAPRLLQFRAQLGEVVDLAVEHDAGRPVGVPHRLRSARKVEDAQTAVPEENAVTGTEPLGIRSAVDQAPRHAFEVAGPSAPRESRDAAHGRIARQPSARSKLRLARSM